MKLGTVTVVLPEKVMRALEKRASSSGRPLEELISDAVLKQLGIDDPAVRAELHLKLCEKYLREAEELLAKGDYTKASEKAWGAASQVVKAVAAKRGEELKSHSALWGYVDKLAEEFGDGELRHLWRTANALHQNFYESWMPPREVKLSVEDVKIFVEKLRKLASR